MSYFNAHRSAVLAAALLVSACATQGPELIVDGPRSMAFQNDLVACQQLAQQRQSQTSDTVVGAVVGGLAGLAEASDGDETQDALVGAALGAGIGRLSGEAAAIEDREMIVINCMQGRGHNVVGQAS